jgi:hypothetical protein
LRAFAAQIIPFQKVEGEGVLGRQNVWSSPNIFLLNYLLPELNFIFYKPSLAKPNSGLLNQALQDHHHVLFHTNKLPVSKMDFSMSLKIVPKIVCHMGI